MHLVEPFFQGLDPAARLGFFLLAFALRFFPPQLSGEVLEMRLHLGADGFLLLKKPFG